MSGRFRSNANRFNTSDKTLWYHADGNAAPGPVMIADLQATATVIALDILTLNTRRLKPRCLVAAVAIRLVL